MSNTNFSTNMGYSRTVSSGSSSGASKGASPTGWNFDTNIEDYERTNTETTSSSVIEEDGSLDLGVFIEGGEVGTVGTVKITDSLGITPAELDNRAWYEKALDLVSKVGATIAVGATSKISGTLSLSEGLLDGVVWVGATVASWFGVDTTGAKEFMTRDLVGEANQAFYENTSIGQAINDASYMKYDSDTAQGIRNTTKVAAEIAAATALTVATGGAAAPFVVGATAGLGYAAESTYQTHGTDTTFMQELGIAGSGALTGLSWMANGKLGAGALNIAKDCGALGAKNVISGLLKEMTTKDFWTNVLKEGLSLKNSNNKLNINALLNYLTSAFGTAGSLTPYITGEEDFDGTAALKLVGTYVSYLGLNILEDMFRDRISTYTSQKIPEILNIENIFGIGDTSSLGNRFDDFTTGKPGTYGIDQAACYRMTFIERINGDWLKNPDDFKLFLKKSFPEMSDSEIEDVMKIFTESPRLSEFGKETVITYLQQKNSDYEEALSLYNHSFRTGKSPDYDRILSKYIEAGMPEKDAIHLLSSINTIGACSYAAQANNIASSFVDNPKLFKETFGYDLFTEKDGVMVFNSAELLSDLYVYANTDINGGKLFTYVDGKLTYLSKDFSQQVYLSGSTFTRDDIIDKFLKTKSINFSFTENLLRANSSKYCMIDKWMIDSSVITIDEIRKKFEDMLVAGYGVQLGIYKNDYHKFTFYNMDGTINVTTNNWKEGNGHAVFVTEIEEDGIIVSSWGEKLKLKFEDFIDNRYNISWGKIYGVSS